MHKESFPPYRPDIDGLRAFAVIAVVIYHAFPDKCRGGFIGVDMFFVISGYLISSIIVRDLQESKFSLLEFYFRRIRRIFPALILVLLACMGVGWKILFQDQMHVLESHIAASSIFASNFLLWGEAGYFNKASISKPLMHLWSLGIEEQFYLVWPVLLLLTYKLKRSFLFPVAILGGMSFLFNLINVQTDPDSAFYLPLPRFWELMTGSALALSGTKLGLLEKKFGNVFSVLGAFLFLIGLAVIHPQREFPGFWALLPVATSAFFIAAGSAGAVNRRILALPIFRKIGLISYPLYLWHWPLLSLAYMNKGRMPPDSTRVVLVALSFLLAWLTYQFVEKPVRNGSRGSIKAIALAGVMIVVGGGAALAYQFEIPEIPKSGLHYAPERNQGWIKPDLACIQSMDLKEEGVFCSHGERDPEPEVAVIGDCAANDLYPGLRKLLDGKVINLGAGTCAPFRGLHGSFAWNKSCDAVNQKIYRYLLQNPKIKIVILSYVAWDIKNMSLGELPQEAPDEEKFKVMEKLVDRDISELKRAGKTVIVNYDSPNLGEEPRRYLMKHQDGVMTESELEMREPYLSRWQELLAPRKDICVFDKFPQLRNGGQFNLKTPSGELLYRDDHHFSFAGSDFVARSLVQLPCFQRAR